MAARAEQKARPDERATVEDWRRHVLIEAGCKRAYAVRLAQTDADLHRMVEAKTMGCPDTLMLSIFV